MIHYIGKVLTPMSILEIIIYSLLAIIITAFLFKWFIYDKYIKPKKAKKDKRAKLPDEEEE